MIFLRRATSVMLTIVMIFAMIAFFCSGCAESGGSEKETALRVQDMYANIQSAQLDMDIRADYGERVYDYRGIYSGTWEEGTLEITSPQEIAGIIISCAQGKTGIKYDGIELSTGDLDDSGLSPAACGPAFLKSWGSGYINTVEKDKIDNKECIAATSDISANTVLTTWFDKETFMPYFAEIIYDGYCVIRCTFNDVVLN